MIEKPSAIHNTVAIILLCETKIKTSGLLFHTQSAAIIQITIFLLALRPRIIGDARHAAIEDPDVWFIPSLA